MDAVQDLRNPHGECLWVAPTGKRSGIPEIGIARFNDGEWQDEWYFGDELGLRLRPEALHMLG